jgi:hypothetical protein
LTSASSGLDSSSMLEARTTRRARNSAVVLLVGLLVAAGAAARGVAQGNGATGTLGLRGTLRLVSNQLDCPLPTTTAGVCAGRSGRGLVPGLGSVSEAYAFLADLDLPPCAVGSGRTLSYPVTFVVAGKGQIDFALAEGATCVRQEAVRTQSQAFTVTGGTGIYAGASGSGTVERTLGASMASGERVGTETWAGTLVAPAVEFDTVRPTLAGAVGRTVRAARGAATARVRFAVTARDAVDGARPVACKPRSGSRFRLGKTRVTCTATDTSGNAAAARFTVTVRATP